MMKTVLFFLCFSGCALLVAPVEAKRTKYGHLAKKLAGLLDSAAVSQGQSQDPEALSGQVARILTFMKQSDVSNGPMAEDLLTQAFAMREELCPSLRTSCSVNLGQQFGSAEMMGLFDEKGTFTRTITRGHDLGKEVVFEHIVPAAICPEFSASLANIRIVRPGAARQSDEPGIPDARAAMLVERSRALLEEQQRYAVFRNREKQVDARRYKSSDYGMGRTKEEHEKVWQQFVDKDPAAVEKEPFIRVEVKKTRSRVGYGTNQLTAQITNRSQHPTEITMDFRMIGLDRLRNNASIQLGRIQRNLKLLQLQNRGVELQGTTQLKAERGKVIIDNRYRGWVLSIRHGGKVISHTASPEFLVDEFPP